jgi:hypothetical protein
VRILRTRNISGGKGADKPFRAASASVAALKKSPTGGSVADGIGHR